MHLVTISASIVSFALSFLLVSGFWSTPVTPQPSSRAFYGILREYDPTFGVLLMDMTSPFDATHTIPVRLVLNADTTWTQSRRSIQEGILHGAINDTLSQMPTSIAKGTNLYIRTAITSTSLQAKLVNVRAPENI